MQKLSFNIKKTSISLVIGLVFLFSFSQVFTQSVQAGIGINRTINFQGKLVNNPASTNVSDTSYTVVFTFYDNASGGTQLWQESQTVTTSGGIFRVALGSVTPFPANFNFNWSGLYLGIKVNADSEMTPRVQMAAVPFAFNAEKVSGLTVQDDAGNASTSGTLQIANAKTIKFTDNITFGTGTTGTIALGTGTNTLSVATTNNTSITLPTSGTLLTNTASAVQTITSTQTTGTVLGIADSTGLTGSITGFNVALTSSTNSQNKTGIAFDLSGGTGGAYYDLLGTGSTWSITRTGVLSVASCSGCGGSGNSPFTEIAGGVIVPNNSTVDLLIGGQSSVSALFSFTGVSNLSHQTQASISGQLVIAANFGYGGNITTVNNYPLTINPNGSGILNLNTAGTGATNIGTSTNTGAVSIGNTTGDITLGADTITASSLATFTTAVTLGVSATTLNLGNSSAATIGTVLDDNLTLTAAGNGDLIFTSDFDTPVLIGTSANTPAVLSVSGGIANNAALIVNNLNNGDLIAASASGVTKFRVANNGDLTLSAGINLGGTNGTSSDCLKGGATAAWGSCGTGSSTSPFAEITGGVIVPNNSTLDFLVGGQATSTAKFGITGVAAGAPIATLSASTNNNGLVLSAATSTIQSLKNSALVLGGNTTGDIYLMPGTGMIFIGENEVRNGSLTLYSSGVGESDPTISADATGNLIFSAPTGTVEVGSGTGNISLEGDADTSIIASFIGIPAADMFQITNSGQAITANGVDGLALAYVLGGSSAVTNAGLTVDLTTTNNNASTVLRGINIGNITGQASATEVGLRIGTGWDSGIAVESGGITVDNAAAAIAIFTAKDNGTAVFTIADGGDITWAAATPTLTINAAETFTISNGTAADNFVYNTSTNALTIGDGTNGLTFDIDTGMTYQGSGRKTKTITLSPEYAGAILTASSSATTNGSMTSDASPSALFRTYYEWSSTQASLQDYTVAVRVTLPQDWSAWDTNSAITINFNTATTNASQNKFDFLLFNSNDASPTTPVVMRTANVSSVAKTWQALTISASALTGGTAKWQTAGDVATIYLKMYAGSPGYIQVGDIALNYLSAF